MLVALRLVLGHHCQCIGSLILVSERTHQPLCSYVKSPGIGSPSGHHWWVGWVLDLGLRGDPHNGDTSWIGFEIGSGSKSLILTKPLCHLWHSSFTDQKWLVYAVLILPLTITTTRTPAKKTSGQTFQINLRSKVWLAWLITCADSWKSFFWVFVERDRGGNFSADFTCQVQKGVAKVCPSMSPSLYSSLRHHFFPILHFCVWSITCPHDAIIHPLCACACQYV